MDRNQRRISPHHTRVPQAKGSCYRSADGWIWSTGSSHLAQALLVLLAELPIGSQRLCEHSAEVIAACGPLYTPLETSHLAFKTIYSLCQLQL